MTVTGCPVVITGLHAITYFNPSKDPSQAKNSPMKVNQSMNFKQQWGLHPTPHGPHPPLSF